MIFGIIAVFSVSLVDTYFIAKLGVDALAAISFTFPVTLTVTSLSIGLSAGAASLISRTLGKGDKQDARVLAADALLLALVFVTILSVIGFFISETLFSFLGASGKILELLVGYMKIWFISMPFLTVPMVANGIIRATGDAFWPSLIMILAAILNIVFTPLFIFGWGIFPELHMEGAAWGTFVARVISLVFALYILINRKHLLSFSFRSFDKIKAAWKVIIKIGLPASLGNATNPIGLTVVTAIVASLGDHSVAAFGVATRLEAFVAIPMLALSSAIGPIAGQNWGAEKYHRVRSALIWCYCSCVIWALLSSIIFVFFAESLSAIFVKDEIISAQSSAYLKIVPFSLWGYGVVIVAAGAFNALGYSMVGLSFYLVRTAILYVPLSWLASLFFQIEGVFYAVAISNVVAGVVVSVLSLYYLAELSKKHRCS